jgi:predicted nucleic acid-binding protein
MRSAADQVLRTYITLVAVSTSASSMIWGTYARPRAECRRSGHPLHQKQHVGDLWIAAAAIRWQLPLVAHDAVYVGCPGVELLTELSA